MWQLSHVDAAMQQSWEAPRSLNATPPPPRRGSCASVDVVGQKCCCSSCRNAQLVGESGRKTWVGRGSEHRSTRPWSPQAEIKKAGEAASGEPNALEELSWLLQWADVSMRRSLQPRAGKMSDFHTSPSAGVTARGGQTSSWTLRRRRCWLEHPQACASAPATQPADASAGASER